MRPIWNRLKENKKDKKLEGKLKVKIKHKISAAMLLFFVKILPIFIAISLFYVAVSWVVDLFQSKNNPQFVYETIGKEDLNELIAVAGNEEDGYYLAYKEGYDEKLDEIVEKYQRIGYYYVNKDVLKKMIQAELVTQYPNLGGEIGHEAKVDETAVSSSANMLGVLKWPTDSTQVTSEFGPRKQPIPGASTDHGGMDIAAAEGTNVYACESGTVTLSQEAGNAGNLVVIDHGNGYVSKYMHNSVLKVSAGDQVQKGQVIALVGSTGNSSGSHLHFQIEKDGTKINPRNFKYENGIGNGTQESFGGTSITSLEGFLLIGDSITDGLRGIVDVECTIKAVVGVGANYWLDNFGEFPDDSQVKGINVFLGTNDYDWGIDNMKKLLDKLHEKYPNKTIYVDKLLPDTSSTVNTTKREQYMSDVKSYCDGKSYLVYIDITSGVNMGGDGYHPASGEDYKTLWNNIKKAIMSSGGTVSGDYVPPLILGEDTGEGIKGFQGTIRIRRVMPDKEIGALVNTGSGQISSGQTMSGDFVGEVSTYLTQKGVSGEWSVYAKNLKTGNEIVQYNDTSKKQSASLIKLFVMATAYQEMKDGNVSVDKNLIKQMITVSDNDATNSIIKTLGNGSVEEGMKKINAYIQANGYKQTEINRLMLQDATNGDNYTSTADVAKILEAIYNGECVSKSASEEMLDYLKAQTRKEKIPKGVPDGVVTASKTGELSTVENDSAIVYKDNAPYVIVVMSSGLQDTDGAKENIRQISKIVYENIDKKKEENKTESNSNKNSSKNEKHVIALVAGHGEDSGAGTTTYTKGSEDTTGTTNPAWKETEKVQEVIELVKKKLKSNSNITIITDGYGKPDSERLKIAKEKGADIFIEVHLGTNSDSSVKGTSAYYQRDSGKKSEKLANTLADSVMSSLGTTKNDGANQTSSKVLNEGKVEEFGGAAVILNGAFMSNEDDMKKISEKKGLDNYAKGIADGITKYIDSLDKGQLDDDENIINETYDTSVKSRIIELKYVPEQKFNDMISENDEEVLKYYTLDGNWDLITAKWSYSSETGITFSKNSAVPYRKVLQKYMTPYEYLMDYYIDIKEDDFIKAFASLIMDSEFIIAVQDNVSTTHTTVTVETVYSDGHTAGGGVLNKDEIVEYVNDSIELTYVDTWFVKFWKDSSYIYGNGTGYRGGLGSKRQQAVATRARNSKLPTKEKDCEKWAEEIYRKEGYEIEEYDNPSKAAEAALPNGDTDKENIPLGALVFGNSKEGRKNDDGSDAGMVGIYIGNDEVASVNEIVSLDRWIENYGWKGWGWYPGTEELAKSSELKTYGSLTGKLTGKSLGMFRLTGYCPCYECSEGWGTQTSSGRPAVEGVTIAVDNNVIPQGAYVYFNGFVFRADDVGGGVKGNHIDVFCNNHEDTFNWEGEVEVFEVDPSTVKEGESSGDASTEVSYLSTNASLMGKVTENKTTSTSSEAGPSIPVRDKDNKLVDTIYTTILTTTNTHTISNQYETGESNVTGNEAKFLKLFRDYPKALNRLKAKWLITAISKNGRTAPMLDLTKYLMYKLLGHSYGVTEFDFSIYEPSSFSNIRGRGYTFTGSDPIIWRNNYSKENFVDWMQNSISISGEKQNGWNTFFRDRAADWYDICTEEGIDPMVMVCIGMLESGFGNSRIAWNKGNLWGWGAVDSNPYGGAASHVDGTGTISDAAMSLLRSICKSLKQTADNPFSGDRYSIAVKNGAINPDLSTIYGTGYWYCSDHEGWIRKVTTLMKTYFGDFVAQYCRGGGDIISACEDIMNMLLERNCKYPPNKNWSYLDWKKDIENQTYNDTYFCCATYVASVLYYSGAIPEDIINNFNYHYTGAGGIPSMLQAAGWTKINRADMQPGDVLNNPGVHVVIYAGDGMVYDQSCAVVSSTGSAPRRAPFVSSYVTDSAYDVWRAP